LCLSEHVGTWDGVMPPSGGTTLLFCRFAGVLLVSAAAAGDFR
jgi:hypothetical protein